MNYLSYFCNKLQAGQEINVPSQMARIQSGDLLACQRDPPLYRTILGTTDSNGSPHEGLGGRAVHPARLPSHVPTLCPSLDFHQRDCQRLVMSLEASCVTVPEEERLVDARGEGDPKHLPGLRGYQPPFCDYIVSYPVQNVNPFLKIFSENFSGPASGRR